MIQSVYNYLVPEFMPKQPAASNNTHKKSELRSLYTHIVNLNKKSPLYKIKLSDNSQMFAISLKESSIALNNCISELSSKEESPFNKMKVISENPNKVAANIVSEDTSNLPEPFTLELKKLAGPQINESNIVHKRSGSPKSGSYSFVVNVEENSYEFQFNIKPDSNNKEILNKLANFINKSNIGIHASVEEVDKDYIYLSMVSENTGDIGEELFSFEDTNAPNMQKGLAEFYDFNYIAQKSSNARFSLSGQENEALTNHLILNHSLQLDFSEPTLEPIEISYIPDADKILTHIEQFKDTYNDMINLAKEYPSEQGLSNKLIRDMKRSFLPFKNEMEACGLYFDKEHMLRIDESLARQAIEEGDMQELFSAEHGLTRNLAKKSSYVTVNPMDYVDKKLVVYPNYSKQGITYPYSATMYSGMLFNYYC